ncbi:MAG TPA: DUF29 domain-containing protein [Acetobacteraceae bacterium]|jgi:hypothetical protein|nr:DUF29 domain-containing protein [Acetobacteraceae bacterium]
MPDDLYEQDILAWSDHQADLLRTVARGQRVNGVDWEHVVEEIEGVGLSELNAMQSHLPQMLVHLLKVHGRPDHAPVRHWREEIAAFQAEAAQRFAPSMRQRINLDQLYARALKQLKAADYERPSLPWPTDLLLTVDQLLNDDVAALETRLGAPRQSASDEPLR